jgi:predicted RNA binding protein YcfA (HicA-like mRNA interferase family)
MVAFVESLGYIYSRSNAHDIYEKVGVSKHVSIPRDRSTLASGTLGSIFRSIGITKAEAERIRNPKAASKRKAPRQGED